MEQKDQQPLDMQETGLGGKMAHIIMSSPGVLCQRCTVLRIRRKGESKTMMSYDKTGGEFPFSKNELCILSCLASERISEMQDNFEEKDPHKYIELAQLNAKLNSLVWMMNRRRENERD